MSDLKPQSLLAKPGFTIVEMVIIAPIVILMIGAFVTVIVNLTGEVLASRSANVLAFNTQDALSRIEADVRLSTKFLAVNNITLTSPQGYDNATGVFQNASATNGNMLILEQPMTAGNPASSAGTALVRKDASLPCSDPNVNSLNTFMTMNVVYFVKTDVNNVSTLWRRTVVPSDYITNSCYMAPVTKPWQQPSCLTGTGGVCLTQDVRLLDGITAADFNVQYFNTPSDTVANSVASDSAALDADRNAALRSTATVGVTLSVTKTAAGRDIGQTGTIRATRLNGGFISTAPTNLTATGGPTQISLAWAAPTNNGGIAISNYKLYRGTTANPTTLVQTLGNVTSYTDTGLVGGTTYYYRIIATNSVGDSPYSTQATATATIYVAPPGNVTFAYTGSVQSWTAPNGVFTATIEVWGAQGAPGSSAAGGKGGYAKGTLTLSAGESLSINVGGMGTAISNSVIGGGGYNGGGNGNGSSGGGGGASDVRKGGTSLANRIIVAGGGGGAGYYSGLGGDGGGLTGGIGANTTNGTAAYGGGGGSQSGGGVGSGTYPGTTGSLGIGGNGGNNGGIAYSGGGGGGYYGAGGGAASVASGSGYGAAGGGGSSYIGGVTGGSTTTGTRSGNGQVIITW